MEVAYRLSLGPHTNLCGCQSLEDYTLYIFTFQLERDRIFASSNNIRSYKLIKEVIRLLLLVRFQNSIMDPNLLRLSSTQRLLNSHAICMGSNPQKVCTMQIL